jgi:diguanylate cyclase (GGDEF)-like protein/PAS domain S-box-containing protein
MDDRSELLEAALDSLPEGLALADSDGNVVYWNRSAEAITGHRAANLLGRPVRDALDLLIVGGSCVWILQTEAEHIPGRGSAVRVRHQLGHELPVLTRLLVLRDALGARIGAGVIFHPAEVLDSLPHGEIGENSRVGQSQSQLEERLESEFEDSLCGNTPLGVLWVTVDQAYELRGTHGARACEAMLEKMDQTLANGLRPTEEMGRWGDDEFLVLSHEHNAAMLAAHGQVLAGLARTTEFRRWGDRVSLTVSIGAAQAEPDESLAELLSRAKAAMLASIHQGGNHITAAPRRQVCSPL